MHPILLELGPVTLYTYGVLLAAAYLLGLKVATVRASRHGLDQSRILDLGIYVIVAALVGAKLLLLVTDFRTFRSDRLGELLFRRVGQRLQSDTRRVASTGAFGGVERQQQLGPDGVQAGVDGDGQEQQADGRDERVRQEIDAEPAARGQDGGLISLGTSSGHRGSRSQGIPPRCGRPNPTRSGLFDDQQTIHGHPPVAKGECRTCHLPHGSEWDALLTMKPEALCSGCHSAMFEKRAGKIIYRDFQRQKL